MVDVLAGLFIGYKHLATGESCSGASDLECAPAVSSGGNARQLRGMLTHRSAVVLGRPGLCDSPARASGSISRAVLLSFSCS